MQKEIETNLNIDEKEKEFQAIALQKKKKENKLIVVLIVISIATILFNTFIAQLAQVNGSSMSPTLENGQLLLISKLHKDADDFERGDVVIFDWNGRHLIKRIIGFPGEKVQIKNNTIYINNKEIEDYVDVEVYDAGVLAEEITLGQDEYIFLGDNRNNSADCREFGAVKESAIIGKVLFRILPPKSFK